MRYAGSMIIVRVVQEWRLHEHIEVSKKMMTQEYSSSNRCHPALSVTCRASRRPGYFYWNVFLVMVCSVRINYDAFYAMIPHVFQFSSVHRRSTVSIELTSATFLFQFFISALSFATFAVSPELPQNRLQLSFTLLLTSVAFKFVINQSLPKISYLTYMVSRKKLILMLSSLLILGTFLSAFWCNVVLL